MLGWQCMASANDGTLSVLLRSRALRSTMLGTDPALALAATRSNNGSAANGRASIHQTKAPMKLAVVGAVSSSDTAGAGPRQVCDDRSELAKS